MNAGVRLVPMVLTALAAATLSGCTVLAIGGAAVAVAGATVSAGVAVGKGAVAVATYPFRDSEADKKRKAEEVDKNKQQ